MANKTLFASSRRKSAIADTINNAGGVAYSKKPKAALAQYAFTGTLRNTYYVSDEDQLKTTLELLGELGDEPEFIAKVAVAARTQGLMKDMPALLLAYLTTTEQGKVYFEKIFPKIVSNGRMARNFVQIIRSGVVGRKSLGSLPKRMMQNFIRNRPVNLLFNDAVGQDPSIADIIRMVHPRPRSVEQEAYFRYLIGRDFPFESQIEKGRVVTTDDLPALIRQYEAFKSDPTSVEVPAVDFRRLSSLKLTTEQWKNLARSMNWNTLRMNLNQIARHGVFDDADFVREIAARLSDANEVRRAKVFPYQLLTAFLNMSDEMPMQIRLALQDALEVATENVPAIEGDIYVMVDTSGSMESPITGTGGHVSKTRCVDVAAMFAATILRSNPNAKILPFDTRVHTNVNLNPRDSIMTNAKLLARSGGGTDCSAPLAYVNRQNAKGDVVIFISDNESWFRDRPSGYYTYHNRASSTQVEWDAFKLRNPKAKLVCIDLTPVHHQLTAQKPDVLNVGGFSDDVFNVVSEFVNGNFDNEDYWVSRIESMEL